MNFQGATIMNCRSGNSKLGVWLAAPIAHPRSAKIEHWSGQDRLPRRPEIGPEPGKIDPRANQNGPLDCQDRFPLHFEAALEVALVFEVASLTGGVQWGRPTKPQACYFQIGNS